MQAKSDAWRLIHNVLRQVERRIVLNEGAVIGCEVNLVAANMPCEDHFSIGKCQSTDTWMFGVYDGHGGAHCSHQLSRRLLDYVCAFISRRSSFDPIKEKIGSREFKPVKLVTTSGNWREDGKDDIRIHSRSLLKSMGHFEQQCSAEEGQNFAQRALHNAFTSLDHDISYEAQPDHLGKVDRGRLAVANSGSCALLCLVDGPHLFIANTGDSSAVLGSRSQSGSWIAKELTNEHSIENPDEVNRIKKSHPSRESNSVLRGGRLLGQLYPLRSFGDVRYKWSRPLQEALLQPIFGTDITPPPLQTPPYLTAEPEVIYHRLSANDRFLVLATDGFWEYVTADLAVRLISEHWTERRPSLRIKKNESLPILDARHHDDNASTHLLKVALGGMNQEKQMNRIYEMLSLPQKAVRDFRDDMTVIIVYFDSYFLSRQT